jgi:hypothetical protein
MKYKIIYWRDGSYEAEIIDKAKDRAEALFLVQEYRTAFNSTNISYQRI